MQRDMDLIRTLLLETESHGNPLWPFRPTAAGYSPEQVAYHVQLLADAGYVDAADMSTLGRLDWRPRSLTWQGHEFLDATRNETVWHKLKAELKDRGVSLPFSLIQDLAIKIAASLAGFG